MQAPYFFFLKKDLGDDPHFSFLRLWSAEAGCFAQLHISISSHIYSWTSPYKWIAIFHSVVSNWWKKAGRRRVTPRITNNLFVYRGFSMEWWKKNQNLISDDVIEFLMEHVSLVNAYYTSYFVPEQGIVNLMTIILLKSIMFLHDTEKRCRYCSLNGV